MGFFRRGQRQESGDEAHNRPTIEELPSNSRSTPQSSTQPTVVEPDEEPVSGSRIWPPSAGRAAQHPRSPLDTFFDDDFGFGPHFGSHFGNLHGFPSMPLPSVFSNSSFWDSPAFPQHRPLLEGQNPGASNPGSRSTRSLDEPYFSYACQSWTSVGNPEGERIEHHMAARGSSDDRMHHVRQSFRERDGSVRTREESLPFGSRRGSNTDTFERNRRAITN